MNNKIQEEIKVNCIKNSLPIYDMLIFHISKNFKNYWDFLNNMYNRKDYTGYYDYIIFPENIEGDDNIKNLNQNQICFGFHDDIDIVDCREIYKYLEISTSIYLQYYPEQKHEVLEVMKKIKRSYYA